MTVEQLTYKQRGTENYYPPLKSLHYERWNGYRNLSRISW
jgi:hypothetical protein